MMMVGRERIELSTTCALNAGLSGRYPNQTRLPAQVVALNTNSQR